MNDLTRTANDLIYFTDQGQSGLHDASGRVYRWAPTAGGAPTIVLDGIPSPNGLALDPSGTQLIIAVTRDNALWRAPLLPDGSVSKVGRWIQLSGGQGPDGIAFDRHGNLWVAHFGLATVWRFDRYGQATLRVHTPGDWPTNLAIHPSSGDVYITESERGEVLRVKHEHLA